jgi:serine/threonine protein kinase/Tol biopolymer transport system component
VLARGAVVGRYVILEHLGEGGMGVVYAAFDPELDRRVAVKLLRPDHASTATAERRRERLQREAKAMARLSHPNVVSVHDLGVTGEHLFVAMDLVEGMTLRAWLAEPRPWRDVVRVYRDAGRGLAAAHQSGIVHRDFKPDNVLLDSAGVARVTDFGLAFAGSMDEPSGPLAQGSPRLTRDGALLGTVEYLAPEVFRGGLADARSDQFSFCVALFEALHGEHPFVANPTSQTLSVADAYALEVLQGRVRPPPAGSDVPAWLHRVVLRGLAVDPAERYPSMEELLADLGRDPAPARRRLLILAGVAVGAGGSAAVIAALLARTPEGPPPDPAPSVVTTRRLTIEPGCEEYPSFTPSGEIIYDGLAGGDYEILGIHPDTGARRRLTTAEGWDYAAHVSPDGRHVAYVFAAKNRELRVIPVEGADAAPIVKRVISTGYPMWTPDGAILTTGEDGQLWRYTLDGVAGPAKFAMPPAAQPIMSLALDDERLVLMWFRSGETRITVLSEVDTTSRIVADPLATSAGGLAPSLAPDAYYTITQGPTGTNQLARRRWGHDAVVMPGAVAAHSGFDISRDGKRLVFSTCQESSYMALLGKDGVARPIQRGDWRDTLSSRMGKRVLFTSDRSGHEQVWSLDPATGESSAITRPGTYGGAASPDGSLVVFVDRKEPGLWILPTAGGAPRRLTSDDTDVGARFTRDGRIVFERSSPGEKSRVWIIGADGTGARPLSPPGTRDASPSLVADLIAYSQGPPLARAIMLLDLGTGVATAVPGILGRRPRFSPDGTKLLYVSRGVEVNEVTLGAGTPPVLLWKASTESVDAAEYNPTGDGLVLSVIDFSGDLWLADGLFP